MYGVLRGRPDRYKREDNQSSPHLQVRVLDATGQPWRIAVNVQSNSGSNVVFWVVDPLAGEPVLGSLPSLPSGFTSVARNAVEVGLARGSGADFRPELLDHDKENELLKALGEFPAVVAAAGELREPHRVARYLEDLAAAYHRFYDNCRILPRGDEEATDRHRARLWLNDATRTVIANGLTLLGVSAPERM